MSFNVCPETVLFEIHFAVKYSNRLVSSVTSHDAKARVCIQGTVHVDRMIMECTLDEHGDLPVQPTLPVVVELLIVNRNSCCVLLIDVTQTVM